MIKPCNSTLHRIITVLLLFATTYTFSQDLPLGQKRWGGAGVSVRVSKKLTLGYSQLFAYNLNPNYMQFTQGNLSIKYRVNKKVSLATGYKPNHFKTLTGNTILYRRVYSDVSYKHKMFSLPIKHTFTYEYHFPQLKKYRHRFIYTLRYYFKNKKLPLKTTPFIKGQLYYYLGGKPLSYYENKVLIVQQSPNDFHRFRITFGVMVRPVSWLRTTLYFTHQKEFNTSLTQYRDLNIPSKNGTRIKYPFNNYNVIGISLNFRIKTY